MLTGLCQTLLGPKKKSDFFSQIIYELHVIVF